MHNIQFQSTVSNLEAMMDACFPQQHKTHVEAFRYHHEKNSRVERNVAIDAVLMEEVRRMCSHD